MKNNTIATILPLFLTQGAGLQNGRKNSENDAGTGRKGKSVIPFPAL